MMRSDHFGLPRSKSDSQHSALAIPRETIASSLFKNLTVPVIIRNSFVRYLWHADDASQLNEARNGQRGARGGPISVAGDVGSSNIGLFSSEDTLSADKKSGMAYRSFGWVCPSNTLAEVWNADLTGVRRNEVNGGAEVAIGDQ